MYIPGHSILPLSLFILQLLESRRQTQLIILWTLWYCILLFQTARNICTRICRSLTLISKEHKDIFGKIKFEWNIGWICLCLSYNSETTEIYWLCGQYEDKIYIGEKLLKQCYSWDMVQILVRYSWSTD